MSTCPVFAGPVTFITYHIYLWPQLVPHNNSACASEFWCAAMQVCYMAYAYDGLQQLMHGSHIRIQWLTSAAVLHEKVTY